MAAKLYAIFALLATVTVALAVLQAAADDLGRVARRMRSQVQDFFKHLQAA